MDSCSGRRKLMMRLRECARKGAKSVWDFWLRRRRKKIAAQRARHAARDCFDQDAWIVAVYAGEAPVGFIVMSGIPGDTQYFICIL